MAKKGSLGSETKKFYKALQESRKEDLKLLVNCPLVEVEEAADILGKIMIMILINLSLIKL